MFTQYIIYGVKVDLRDKKFDDEDEEKFEEYEDDYRNTLIVCKNNINTITDGMNGEYMYVGKILKKSPKDEPLDCCDLFKIYTDFDFNNRKYSDVRINIKQIIPDVNKSVCKLHLVTHYY